MLWKLLVHNYLYTSRLIYIIFYRYTIVIIIYNADYLVFDLVLYFYKHSILQQKGSQLCTYN